MKLTSTTSKRGFGHRVNAWLGIGALHYSDSHDRQLARGVSALDSVTLI
jgi:hypothetical protein